MNSDTCIYFYEFTHSFAKYIGVYIYIYVYRYRCMYHSTCLCTYSKSHVHVYMYVYVCYVRTCMLIMSVYMLYKYILR